MGERRGGEGGRRAAVLWHGGDVGWRRGGAVEREAGEEGDRRGGAGATTRNVWFFNILFMSKHMELMSQLKIFYIQLTKIQTSKNQRHKLIMTFVYLLSQAYDIALLSQNSRPC